MTALSAMQLARRIEDDILAGRAKAGEQLPSVRTQADLHAISPTTVAAAYRRLRERGLVVGRGRQGTVVAPPSNIARVAPVAIPDGVVNVASGTPDPAQLPPLQPALLAACSEVDARYGDAMVDPALAVAARRDFADDGIDASHLAVTSGAMDAIERIIAAQRFRVGDRIGVEDPGHIPVHQLCRSAGLELVPIAIDDAGITPESLSVALAQGISAVVVTPRAQNPTGAAFTKARALALSEILAEYPEVVVIQDDHAGAVSGVPLHSITVSGTRWATIRSLGKSLGPDLRVASVVGDQRTIDVLLLTMSNGPGWVSKLLQRAAAWLLQDPETQRRVEQAAATYRHQRESLVDALADVGVVASAPSGFNVWIPVGDEQSAVSALREAGFAVRAAGASRIASGPAVRVTPWPLRDGDVARVAEAFRVQVDADHRSAAV